MIRGDSEKLPDPNAIQPVANLARVVFLKPLRESITGFDHVEIGDFTYYDDPLHARDFFRRNIVYDFRGSGTRLRIGKFCAFAHALPMQAYPWRPSRDTVVGNDVWIGAEALILPGVTIGDGAVIGTRAVVSRDVPPYAVVAGNPARVVRRRYAEDDAARLSALAWWDWPAARIARAIPILVKGDVAALEAFARAA